jgi:hypothetical protein
LVAAAADLRRKSPRRSRGRSEAAQEPEAVEPKQRRRGARARSLAAEVVAREGAREWRVLAAEAPKAEGREAEAWEAVRRVPVGRPVTELRGQARTEAAAEVTGERRGTQSVAVAADKRRAQAARMPVRPVPLGVRERWAWSNAGRRARPPRRIQQMRAAALAAGPRMVA